MASSYSVQTNLRTGADSLAERCACNGAIGLVSKATTLDTKQELIDLRFAGLNKTELAMSGLFGEQAIDQTLRELYPPYVCPVVTAYFR